MNIVAHPAVTQSFADEGAEQHCRRPFDGRFRVIRVFRCALPMLIVAVVVVSGAAISLPAQSAGLTVDVSNRAELIAAVSRAQPGTTIRLAPGEYPGGLSFDGLRGTKTHPIIIEAQN
ncbi:MAG: hypothetical protein KDA96_10945, partial [Planctomycetaceae bacterium]|nr:hypothetical protein [Planctomycetaceae bacterium]